MLEGIIYIVVVYENNIDGLGITTYPMPREYNLADICKMKEIISLNVCETKEKADELALAMKKEFAEDKEKKRSKHVRHLEIKKTTNDTDEKLYKVIISGNTNYIGGNNS